jgi:hypothetical protein
MALKDWRKDSKFKEFTYANLKNGKRLTLYSWGNGFPGKKYNGKYDVFVYSADRYDREILKPSVLSKSKAIKLAKSYMRTH